jgi:hypothetical protein
MFLATANPARQLLYSSYIQHVTAEDIRRGLEDTKTLLAGLSPGFRLLVDLSQLESFDLEGVAEIGRLMELIDRSGVGMVVRVIPDPDKDIGMNILSVFHYPHHPRIVTYKTMAEALRALQL